MSEGCIFPSPSAKKKIERDERYSDYLDWLHFFQGDKSALQSLGSKMGVGGRGEQPNVLSESEHSN